MRGIFAFLCLVSILEIAKAAPETAGTLEDLHAHRFDAIEQRFEAIDESFKRGSISEFDLLDAYKPFYQHDDILSQDMTAWVRAHPKSYVAHLANGTYRRKLGEFHRGEGYNQSVPLDVQGYVTQQFKTSQQELWLALKLRPGSFLAMLNLLNIARYEDDDTVAKKMLDLGTIAYPGNLLIRARYMTHLTPRWGGSAAAMNDFVAKSRASGVHSDVMRLLEAIRCDDDGFSEWETGRLERAVDDYRRCIMLSHGADPRFIASYLPHSSAHCEETGNGLACR